MKAEIWAVLATGPSLSAEQVQSVKECKTVAVSNAYKLAPWADALASSDAKWWQVNKEAQDFPGLKFTAAPDHCGLPNIERLHGLGTGINSGLLGIHAAVHLGAKRILLLGFDLHSPGQHFFGQHPKELKSSTQNHLDRFKAQFSNYKPRGIEIINCTPDSALKVYPLRKLEDCLSSSPL